MFNKKWQFSWGMDGLSVFQKAVFEKFGSFLVF
jgi:hypothetical protein